ncbi:hypothetical protein F0562_001233 [Nyssa sinensis]|uniref:DYW domain-containing protein n=1 Tax=Nyssa sinensis TaxID=561372 RepID=A0A5J5C3N0_9ASTE|nr:hypothetical protein F0562_001233 [Nyssa sinensis]
MEVPVPINLQNNSFLAKQSLTKDSKHWNSIIKDHTKLKDDQAILTTYTQMEALGISPHKSTLPLVLKACGRLQAIERGKKIHYDIWGTDLIDDVRVRTALVDFYCKCGFLEDARYLFDEMNDKDVVSWNAMICGLVGCSCYEEALVHFMQMQKENLEPNSVTVVGLLSACRELLEMRRGKEIHGYCLRNGLFNSNPHVGTALIGFYLRFDVTIAHLVFEMMVSRNIVSWNAMISGHFDEGDSLKALDLFVQMIIDGVKCDYVTIDVALWNSIISVYAEIGSLEEAMSLFTRMRLEGIQENEITIVILLALCADSADSSGNGKSLHAYVIKNGRERNTPLGNALLSMYAELNCIEDSLKVFDEIRDLDVISWNTLILTLARNKLKDQAWALFGQMRESDIKPNSHTIISILAVCKDVTFLNIGRSIHSYVIKHDIEMNPSLNTALTEMYMNCGDETTARNLFESSPDKDLISWNALIASYVKNNQADRALLLFHYLISEVEPNSVTIINVLSSCTHLANLRQGQCLHTYTIRRDSSLGFNLYLANAFITMYARCGKMQYAEKIFKTLPKRNIVSWNAMIAGYGMHGRGCDAMLAFSQMLEDGCKPNGITFVSALSACSHSGLIEKGLQLFHSMVQDFYITPELVHYACVVDLLGRAGCLDEAREFITSMPIEPDASVWRALLSPYRVYSETKQAKIIFEKLIELEPTNAGNYILLSNIYAAEGLWSEVRKLRLLLEEKGLKKPPGKSWIVVRNKIHCFTAGDRFHPQTDRIYARLSYLLSSIKEIGYVPDLRWVLHDEKGEKKMKRLFSHSEKLAIAFGLINVSGGAPILITKNLRVDVISLIVGPRKVYLVDLSATACLHEVSLQEAANSKRFSYNLGDQCDFSEGEVTEHSEGDTVVSETKEEGQSTDASERQEDDD